MQDEVGLLLVSSIAGEVLIQLDEHYKAFVDVCRMNCFFPMREAGGEFPINAEETRGSRAAQFG
jgi:hypothetical protein